MENLTPSQQAARKYLATLGDRRGCDIQEIVDDDEIFEEIVEELAKHFEKFLKNNK